MRRRRVLTAGTSSPARSTSARLQYAAGRMGDPVHRAGPHCCARGRFVVDRLKTGTPPRTTGTRSIISEDGGAARRRPAPGDVVHGRPRRPARAGQLRDHPDHRAHPPADPRCLASQPAVFGQIRGHRPAPLPVDRGQGGALAEKASQQVFVEPEGPPSPGDPPRTASPAAAVRRAVELCSIVVFLQAHITCPATRSNTTSFDPCGLKAWKPRRWRGCSSLATGPHHRLRGRRPRRACWPA